MDIQNAKNLRKFFRYEGNEELPPELVAIVEKAESYLHNRANRKEFTFESLAIMAAMTAKGVAAVVEEKKSKGKKQELAELLEN